jgi:LPXTG-site transpeptidase (sortase) family protein
MSNNPLFQPDKDEPRSEQSPTDETVENASVEIIRQKVSNIYDQEPNWQAELDETNEIHHRSKHQQFMYHLSTTGKDMATIQTEWHKYYSGLSDREKFQVWQEFYDSQALLTRHHQATPGGQAMATVLAEHKHQAATSRQRQSLAKNNQPRATIKDRLTGGGQLNAKHNLQSLLFGLGVGFVVVFIFLFSFFNEVFIAPFIQPSRSSPSTPIILSDSGVAPTTNPEVIIPKINVEIPVNYTVTSTDENVIESDLQDGVVHFPTTVEPGQTGNAAFFGHSSNNIFNQGNYKFAFVLLHTLVNGDTFYLTYNDKLYVYKVISKTVVSPSDIAVLGPVAGQTATATLITCDPPGTSINRLIVVGQQISPDPTTDSAPPIDTASYITTPTKLPGNGPSLWTKFITTITGKTVSIVVVVAATGFVLVKLNRRFKSDR